MATPTQYVQTNTLYQAGAGSTVGATSISLTSLTDIYGNVLTMSSFGVKGYITFEPDTTNEEAATFTGITPNANGTYTLTGLSSVIAQSPYTETSGLVRAHAGGSKVVVTDNVAFWNTFANKANDETIAGQWTFTNTPIVPGTVSDASTTVKGVSKTSVAPATANNPIVVGTNDPRVPVAYAVDSVGTDSYAITPSPAIIAYAAGQQFTFKAGTANTGAASLNVNGLGAKTIKKNVATDVATGDILLNQIITVVYDGTNMQMVSNNPQIPVAYSNSFQTKNLADASVSNTYAHNLGIVPRKVRFTASYLSNGTTQMATLFGVYDASGQNSVYTWWDNAGNGNAQTSNTAALRLAASVSFPDSSGQSGVVSVDATNVTVVWTKSGTPTGTISFIMESEG